MKKSVVAGLLLATVCATAAMAGVIEDRQAIMKSFGGTGRTLGGMANGTTPFDAAVAKLDKAKPITMLVRRGEAANYLILRPTR